MTISNFRAWDSLTNKMFPVEIIDYSVRSVYIEESNGLSGERDFDDIELMQFTGLKDKNGKEVFEGDIIKDNGGFIAYVVYDKDYAFFSLNYKPFNSVNGLSISFEELRNTYNYNFEVIGNIYENQELLRGE